MDEKKAEVDAEDVMMQYTSPSAEGPEAQFYHLPTREQDMGQHVEQQEPNHVGLPALQEHQEAHEQHQEEEHHDLHELQELQDPPTPHENHTTSVSADELQLAAQLTQGLAPMIAAANNQEQEQQQLHTEDTGMENHGDANLHEQLQAQLQSHDQMQNHDQLRGHDQMQTHDQMQAHDQMQGHDQMQNHDQLQAHDQLQNHNQLQSHDQMQTREHELQDVLSHAEQSQVHTHYVQNSQPAQHMPSHTHSPIDGMSHPQYPIIDNTPPRKRSKVSRACDECRRKKIKCDAQSEPGGQPCSNCRRASAQCLFSRVPQKRGPSKGYIKELADRINNIEGKFGISKEDSAARRPSAEAYASPTPGDEARKRPYSSISVDGFSAPSPARHATWVAEHKPIRPYNADYRPPYSVNDLAPKPEAPTPSFSGPMDSIPQDRPDVDMEVIAQNGLVPDGLPAIGLQQDDLSQDPLHQVEQTREIDDATFDCYLSVIHRTLPVLASTKLRVQSLLGQCPATLQNAFFNAFYALVNPFVSNSTSQDFGDSITANQLLGEWEAERHPRSSVTDLVYLQTLIMMVIEADHHGLASVNGQSGGPPKSSTIGRAAGLGFSMRLHLAQPDPTLGDELDPDSDDNVALRAWWTLVMLDRWNAIGTASPTIISNDNAVILPGLGHIVGDAVFLFTKLSYLLGHLVPLALRPSADPYFGSAPVLGSFSDAVAESFRWQFPAELDEAREPGLHLAYWHFRLLGQLFSATPKLDFVYDCCKNIVRLLTSNVQLLNPLTHHFVCLASLVLLELTKVENLRDEATKLAKEIVDFNIAPSPWNTTVRNKILDKTTVRPEPSTDLNSQTLQQLADLATAVDAPPPPNPESVPPAQNAASLPLSLPTPAITADTLKEDLLDSIKGLNEDHQQIPPTHNNINTVQQQPPPQLPPVVEKFDPQAIIRSGYLACFSDSDEASSVEGVSS